LIIGSRFNAESLNLKCLFSKQDVLLTTHSICDRQIDNSARKQCAIHANLSSTKKETKVLPPTTNTFHEACISCKSCDFLLHTSDVLLTFDRTSYVFYVICLWRMRRIKSGHIEQIMCFLPPNIQTTDIIVSFWVYM
jgi:hypothetical protein